MSKQYVQHISGQGTIYRVAGELVSCYIVDQEKQYGLYRLPKADYKLCNPPERWVDVTAECKLDGVKLYIPEGYIDTTKGSHQGAYRLRKVNIPTMPLDEDAHVYSAYKVAFIVEKREP